MQEHPEEQQTYNPLRHLTPAQFMALGGNAVVYVKPILGGKLAELMAEPDFDSDTLFQLVVSADGTPLLIADSTEAVAEWLAGKDFGIVALH
ncbi:DUF1150 family protein [Devosia sp.]|uniref:DUF1150 family protein n=1 Tax=Devosia sp. TaxID=1871048 RepID=UPI001321C36B|nr:MAG: DUF1150 family protein [Bauldia sp.]